MQPIYSNRFFIAGSAQQHSVINSTQLYSTDKEVLKSELFSPEIRDIFIFGVGVPKPLCFRKLQLPQISFNFVDMGIIDAQNNLI